MTDSNSNYSDLPQGWKIVQLQDIAEINPKLPYTDLDDSLTVSFLPMASVEEVSGKYDLSQTRLYGEVKKGYTAFINGDIIFAKITPCMENGKIAIVENLQNGIGFGSTEFHVSRIKLGLNKRYLFYYFTQASFKREARRNMTGSAGQLRVPKKYFESVEIPLPPLPEQHRIVEKIEELFSELDDGVASLKKALEQLKTYRQAVLKWAFEGKLTEKWRNTHQDSLEDGDTLLEQIKAERKRVYANFLDLNEVYEIGLRQEEVEKFLLVKNDLLIIEGNGSIDQIGRVAIWNDKINPCVHQNHVIKARPHTNTNPLFSLYFLLSHQGRKFIKKQAGSTSGLYTLSLSKVRNLNIPFCSLQEQTKIVQEIESRLSVCDQLEATLTENLDKAEALRQSILKRAFEGKLVL